MLFRQLLARIDNIPRDLLRLIDRPITVRSSMHPETHHTMSRPITVHVTHGEPLLEAGMAAALYPHAEFAIVHSFAQHESLGDVQVIVTGYSNGLMMRTETLKALGYKAPAILIVTPYRQGRQIRTAIEHGIQGYILQNATSDELVAGVRAVAQGRRYITPSLVAEIANSLTQSSLTVREGGILHLLAKGHSNKAIAKALDISMNTAKAHVKTIMRKLDSVTRTQAVVTTMDRGLIDDRELFNTAAN